MKKYRVAALMLTMAVFVGCDDDDGETNAGSDAGRQDAAQANAGRGGAVGRTDAGPADANGELVDANGDLVDANGDLVDANGGGVDAGGGVDGAGDSAGGGLAFFTSVAGSKVVAELSDADRAQLCSDGNKWKAQLKKAGLLTSTCRLLGAVLTQTKDKTLAEIRIACEKGVSGCVAEQEAKAPDEQCDIAPPACNITVGELQNCRTDRAAAITALADSLPPCTNAEITHFGMLKGSDSVVPGSCKAAEERCPGISR